METQTTAPADCPANLRAAKVRHLIEVAHRVAVEREAAGDDDWALDALIMVDEYRAELAELTS